MMWKPTRVGLYRYKGRDCYVWPSWAKDETPMFYPDASPRWEFVQDGPWSLLCPEWQQGAPTVAQLERWPWWALALKGREYKQVICGKVSMSGDPSWLYIPSVKVAAVVKSAPIQPNLENGPLWVPLEVCK